ncbi:hypothetical protein GIX45_19890 [Erwinia sp. CPCC 100877]|nr:hypothetical protein [Erwinia sp. CPCC 100877]
MTEAASDKLAPSSTHYSDAAIMLRLNFRNVFGMILATGSVTLASEGHPGMEKRVVERASRVDRVL